MRRPGPLELVEVGPAVAFKPSSQKRSRDLYSRVMPNGTNHEQVRPLRGGDHVRREQQTPRFVAVIALLAIGGLVGWVAASLGNAPSPTPTTSPVAQPEIDTTPASRDASLGPSVEWTKANAVPEMPDGMEYRRFSAVAEVDGHINTAAVFADPTTGEEASQLWESVNGLDWKISKIDVGEPLAAQELVAVGDGLLLTGQTEDSYAMWRSIPGRAINGSSWAKVSLEIPVGFQRGFLRTAVNSTGGNMTVAIGSLELWREVIGPYLPDGVDLGDPGFVYRGGSFLYKPESSDDIELFSEPPEVVVAGDNVWVRIVTPAGEEVIQTFPLPPGTYPVGTAPTLENVSLSMAWFSDDGIDFLPVVGVNALPSGYFLPKPWGEGFVGAVYEMDSSVVINEAITLWGSRSGRAWQPQQQQVPKECSPFQLAISGNRMHLTSEDGTQCIRDIDSPWEILDEPSTSTYVVGGGAGFVSYPDSFEYDTALFSHDGISWARISIPTPEPYPGIMVLEDRLLALSVSRPNEEAPPVVEIWLGKIS